jgi:hypothetical protein
MKKGDNMQNEDEDECEENIYLDSAIAKGLDEDALSASEAGFMRGYIEAYAED